MVHKQLPEESVATSSEYATTVGGRENGGNTTKFKCTKEIDTTTSRNWC